MNTSLSVQLGREYLEAEFRVRRAFTTHADRIECLLCRMLRRVRGRGAEPVPLVRYLDLELALRDKIKRGELNQGRVAKVFEHILARWKP